MSCVFFNIPNFGSFECRIFKNQNEEHLRQLNKTTSSNITLFLKFKISHVKFSYNEITIMWRQYATRNALFVTLTTYLYLEEEVSLLPGWYKLLVQQLHCYNHQRNVQMLSGEHQQGDEDEPVQE